MKKSELMGYLVYAILFAIAIAVGLLVIRPIMAEYAQYAPFNSILFLVVAILAGLILNAAFIELGHFLGAKIGRYKVYQCVALWVGIKEITGKTRLSFSNFDGFLGETKISPKDEKSNPIPYIYMPLVLLLVEVIALVVVIALAENFAVRDASWQWWKMFAITMLTCGALVYVYDYFPAALDAKNDGYLMTVLNSRTNKEAYNDMLKAEYSLYKGEKVEDQKVYDNVTNFTSRINKIALSLAIDADDYEKAVTIADKTIASKDNVSSAIYEDAVAERVSLLMLGKDFEEGKKEYINSPLEIKKHIAAMSTPAAARSYILVSGLVDESQDEFESALTKVDSIVKKAPEKTREGESKLIKKAIAVVTAAHKDWDLSNYNLNIDEPKAEEKPAEEAKPTEEEKPSEGEGNKDE